MIHRDTSKAWFSGNGQRLSAAVTGLTLLFAGFICTSYGHAQGTTFVPVISTPVGGGKAPFCAAATDAYGDGCLASTALLSGNYTSVSDAAGNLYIGDMTHILIRKVDAKTGIITVIAGGQPVCAAATDTLGDGCPATQSTFATIRGMSMDPNGNLVFADSTTSADYRVRIVNLTTGIINTLAGSGTKGTTCPSNTNPVPASQANLNAPYGTAFDLAGNLYIANSGGSCVVLVVATNGVINPATSLAYTLIGTGTAGHAGIPGPSTSVQLNGPHTIQVDAAGNIYTFDFSDYSVSVTTSPFLNGVLNIASSVTTNYAGGTYIQGTTGDGGSATAATLGPLQGGLIDAVGNIDPIGNASLYDDVRSINPVTGIINRIIGTGVRSNTGDGGPAVTATISGPDNGNYDRFGRIFINATSGNTVRSVSLDNVFPFTTLGTSSASQNLIATNAAGITLQTAAIASLGSSEFVLGTLPACATGTALAAGAYCSLPVTFTPAFPGLRRAVLTLTDTSNVTTSIGLTGYGVGPAVDFSNSVITTIGGTGTAGSGGDGAAATAAKVSAPRGGMFDAAGNLFFADSGNNEIRRIDASTKNISIVAGTGVAGNAGDTAAATAAKLNGPTDVYVDPAGNLYICDSGNNTIRYVSAATGIITTIAGTGSAGYTGNGGLPTAATFKKPLGLTVDPGGFVYVADSGNNAVRRFNVGGGQISTMAGTGTAGYSGDGAAAPFAQLSGPSALSYDLSGNLYIADSGNGVVRVISSLGTITTFAGKQGGTTNAGDGGLASAASLISPSDVATDAAGDVYIASGNQVRVVNTAGVISLVAGTSGSGNYAGEGGDATNATLPTPVSNLMLDTNANVYLSATAANRLLEVSSSTAPPLAFGVQSVGGTSAALTTVLRNTGNASLTISAISIPTAYAINSGSSNECAVSLVVAPGASCSMDVTFTPAGNGPANGTIVITDNALNSATSTQSIAVSGSGSSTTPTTTVVTVSPASPVYGTAVSATVSVTGTHSPSGSVTVKVDNNSITNGTMTLASGSAVFPLGVLSAGTHSITASYAGDTNNGSSGGTFTLVVAQAVLTVTAANATKHQGDPNPTLTAYTITGFVNGDTQSVVTGVPVESTTATTTSPQGNYPISIVQGTLANSNYSFTMVPGTLTVTAPLPGDFTVSVSPATLSIVRGVTGTVTLSFTPIRSYAGNIGLNCSGQPIYASCTFNPSTVTMDGVSTLTSVVTVGTVGYGTSLRPYEVRNPRSVISLASIPLLAFGALLAMRRKRRALARLLSLLLVMSCTFGISGCADAIGSRVAVAGTSTVTITATDGTTSHTTSFVLTITSP